MPLTTRFFFVSAANRIGPFVTLAEHCHPGAIRRGSQKDLNAAGTEVNRRLRSFAPLRMTTKGKNANDKSSKATAQNNSTRATA